MGGRGRMWRQLHAQHRDRYAERIYPDCRSLFDVEEDVDIDDEALRIIEAEELQWMDDMDYASLCRQIRTSKVLTCLKESDILSIADIKKLRRRLHRIQRNARDGSQEQWEALHVDIYYEQVIQARR